MSEASKIAKALLDNEEKAKDFIKRHQLKLKNSKKPKFLPLGTISHGTLNTDHLLQRFMQELKAIDPEKAAKLQAENEDILRGIEVGDADEADVDVYKHEFLENLISIIGDYAPPYAYFGTLEGDGSDFGVWVSEDMIDDGITEGEIEEICSQDPRATAFFEQSIFPHTHCAYVLFRNDDARSSLELYDTKTQKEVWTT